MRQNRNISVQLCKFTGYLITKYQPKHVSFLLINLAQYNINAKTSIFSPPSTVGTMVPGVVRPAAPCLHLYLYTCLCIKDYLSAENSCFHSKPTYHLKILPQLSYNNNNCKDSSTH